MEYRPIASHERPEAHMQWGLLAPATVILGGAGLLFLAGSQEVAQNGGGRLGVSLFLAGGLAIWGLLALLYVLNWRAAKVRAAMARNSFIVPKKGGFLKGALLGALMVLVVQVAAVLFAFLYPGLDPNVQGLTVIAAFYMSVLYGIVPLITGVLGRMWRATSI